MPCFLRSKAHNPKLAAHSRLIEFEVIDDVDDITNDTETKIDQMADQMPSVAQPNSKAFTSWFKEHQVPEGLESRMSVKAQLTPALISELIQSHRWRIRWTQELVSQACLPAM
jgi:hypothetical protein